MVIEKRSMGIIVFTFSILTLCAGAVFFFVNTMLFCEVFVCFVILVVCLFSMRIGFKLLTHKNEHPISIEEIRKRVERENKKLQQF
jgi:Flp pilus assembly protein TadB